jgi:RNA polymerase sigma-70 factor (ECF subfamily)
MCRPQSAEDRRREFEGIALQYMDSLYGMALGMTRDKADAEDLVQDTYLRAYRFFDRFERGTNFRAWLFTILRNTYINRYRSESRAPKMLDISEIQMSNLAIAEPTPEEHIFGDLLDDCITNAMDSLPEDYRVAVTLSDLGELSYKEIADMLQIPIGTVMSRLHRGRKLLRGRLSDYAKKRGYVGG